ncbi:hypothetical protein [Burkholderia stabilis]|uniref:Uncharacterized protein n=1 Tax=Burkholderia stabilis TaxID=95485 RepID=A0A1Y1BS01_9BURK|nr:hypothetical protein [Burkholderia stabilis]BAX62674.1 hypothetical protein BSFP_055420 [Burkholderia stabilis]
MRPSRPTDPAARFERQCDAFTRGGALPRAIRVSLPDYRCARLDARNAGIVPCERAPTRIA